MTTDELWVKFEALISQQDSFSDISRTDSGEYLSIVTDKMWMAWQAGHAFRDAEVEALRKDAEHIDALENWCIEGCVDIGIELEGGVYLHLATIGESDVDYREKNTVREAIDAAREKQL